VSGSGSAEPGVGGVVDAGGAVETDVFVEAIVTTVVVLLVETIEPSGGVAG
jgi:hypothetical protein